MSAFVLTGGECLFELKQEVRILFLHEKLKRQHSAFRAVNYNMFIKIHFEHALKMQRNTKKSIM